MRIVVAGSSGLIGTALVTALRQEGHEVLRLVRRPQRTADERRWDPSAGQVDDGTFDGADVVVNLCGAAVGGRRWSGAYKQELRDSRIEPTDVLARAVAEHGVPMLVNASAVGFYGDTGGRKVDESAPPGSGFLAELCRDWEAATEPATAAGARVLVLRTGLVLTSSGGLLRQLLPVFRFMLGGRLGNGRQYLPWISLRDQIGAMQFLIGSGPELDLRGPVNLTGPEPVTNAEFTRELAQVLGRPAPWVVPGFALRAVAGELAEQALTGQRAVPAVLQGSGYRFAHSTVRAALHAAI